MLYRKNPKNGKELSILGYGCLRFTKKGGMIDQKKAEEEMKAAIENGVNYFDTAYTYHGSVSWKIFSKRISGQSQHCHETAALLYQNDRGYGKVF